MPEERLVISVNERGSLVVKRNLERIGEGGRKASKGVNLLKGALIAVAGVGVLQALRNAVAGTIKVLREFSQGMSTVKAITGATEEQFQGLREEAKRLGAETRFTATQAAEGMQFLARAGFTVDEVMQSTEATLKLAQAGALDLGRAADISSNILTGFRLEAHEMNRVVDVMALTANSANTNIEQLGDAMKFVAPIAAEAGISIEETSAAIGKLSDAGLQATLAGTGLRRIVTSLEAPSKLAAEGIESLGLSVEDVRPSIVGLQPAMARLADAGLDIDRAMKIFTIRGGTAALVLSKSNQELATMTENLNDAGGTADDVSAIMDDNLNGAFLRLNSAIEAFRINLADLGSGNLLTKAINDASKATRFWANNLENVDRLLKRLPKAAFNAAIGRFGDAGDAGAEFAAAASDQTAQIDRLKKQVADRQAEVRRIQTQAGQDFLAAGGPRNIFEGGGEQINAAEIERQVQRRAALQEVEKALKTENDLLKLNTTEREVRLQIMQAEEAIKGSLSEAERSSIRALVEQNAEIKKQNELRQEQEELKAQRLTQFEELKAQLQQESELLLLGTEQRAIQRQLIEAEAAVKGGLTEAERAVVTALIQQNQALAEQNNLVAETADSVQEINQFAERTFSSAFDAFLRLTSGGKDAFRDFANSVLQDISRIAAKQSILQIGTAIGGSGAGSFLKNLLGFANGGSVTVGGSGGADSKLFAAKVSPGERIDFTPRSQQQAQNPAGTGAVMNMTTVIVRSEDEAMEIFRGPRGRDGFVNIVRENKKTIKQVIG